MENSVDLMERLFERSNAPNLSAFAMRIGVTRAQMSRYMKGHNVPADKTILKIAKVCNFDHYELLLKFSWCRTEPEAKVAYEHLYHSLKDGLKKSAVTLALVALSLSPLGGNEAQAFEIAPVIEAQELRPLSHNSDKINIMRLIAISAKHPLNTSAKHRLNSYSFAPP